MITVIMKHLQAPASIQELRKTQEITKILLSEVSILFFWLDAIRQQIIAAFYGLFYLLKSRLALGIMEALLFKYLFSQGGAGKLLILFFCFFFQLIVLLIDCIVLYQLQGL
jgi:hypothetical protein